MSSEYANAKFLIYRKFETPFEVSGLTGGGSLLIGSSMNEEEATRKVNILKQSYEEFNRQFPSISKTDYCYIANNPEWWKPLYR
jgi:hypothetical protein